MKVAVASFGGPQSYGSVAGSVVFSQASPRAPVEVRVLLAGVPRGLHGMHVHEKRLTPALMLVKDCCKQLGGHFNGGRPLWSPKTPDGTKHGRHVGDLNFNVRASQKGLVDSSFTDTRISLHPESPNCVVGRSLVLHKDRDDTGLGGDDESLITGNAGERIACANILAAT